MSHWSVDDLVDVYLGTQWCPGVIEEVIRPSCYCVLLDTAPSLDAVGMTHSHAAGSDTLGRRVLITEASNNFLGIEKIRDQV